MQATKRTHAIKIPFKVPVSSETSVDRFAFIYLIFGDSIHLIDSGVAGAESIIWEYIKKQGREPKEVSTLILTHSHPDHIGAAKSIKNQTSCTIFAHKNAQNWIEDTEQQFNERPVPGFQTLVEGSVDVDRLVDGGEILTLEKDIICKIIHTPGHSKGSIAILTAEGDLFCGDLLVNTGKPAKNTLIDDPAELDASVEGLRALEIETVYPGHGKPFRMEQFIEGIQ